MMETRTSVPESVTTPDKVHTELLGELKFFDQTWKSGDFEPVE